MESLNPRRFCKDVGFQELFSIYSSNIFQVPGIRLRAMCTEIRETVMDPLPNGVWG